MKFNGFSNGHGRAGELKPCCQSVSCMFHDVVPRVTTILPTSALSRHPPLAALQSFLYFGWVSRARKDSIAEASPHTRALGEQSVAKSQALKVGKAHSSVASHCLAV